MIDISFGGLIGAIVGTIVAALVYGALTGLIERVLAARRAQEPQEPVIAAGELAMLRRGVFMFDILICAGIGYWIGDKIGG
jgi:tetrahydromethanopterin S-methyltransferase subunit D